jgi:NAD(P)-dependent dehydrogenase (short-subunit alcohol dehydrogenase family)
MAEPTARTGKGQGTLVVTGASRGIGAATAGRAATAGYDVCVNCVRHRAAAELVADEVKRRGRRALIVEADVSEEGAVTRMFDVAERELGPVTALVNNAGITGGPAPLSELESGQLVAAFRVNLLGTFLCLREAVRRFRASRTPGRIVNVSSTAARTTGAGEWVHYAATKAAVDTLTRGAARELAPEGIRVNAVAPGLVMTDLHADNGRPGRPERLRPTVPLGRIGNPDEIAHAIVWLLSDEASYVTGSVLEVSGGR